MDEYAARPIAYFSHDANAHADIKCKRLKRKLGMAGYGRWWQLCEVLAGIDGHHLPTATDDDWELIADFLEFPTTDEAKEFIDVLRGLQLIEPDMDFVWSKRMNKTAERVGKVRRGGARGNAKRWGISGGESGGESPMESH